MAPSSDVAGDVSTPPPLPGEDRDLDGYAVGTDCDEADWSIHPGVAERCEAPCGTGHRTCGDDGAFTACSCEVHCEATAGGRCYYISAERGRDEGDGTFADPWRTASAISYAGSLPRVVLSPGDVVYFLEGTYTRDTMVYLRGHHGSEAAPSVIRTYPGHHVVLETIGGPGRDRHVVTVYDSTHLVIQGFEIRGGYGNGLLVTGEHIELRDLRVHDVDGDATENSSGIHLLGASYVDLHHSDIYDNYDRTWPADAADHKQNVIAFGGGHVRIHHNRIRQSPGVVNGGITYKHRATIDGAPFEADHNVFSGLASGWLGSGTPHTFVHHNLVQDCGPITFTNFGGPTHNADLRVEHNTILGRGGLVYRPIEGDPTPGSVAFRANVVVSSEPGVVLIGEFGTQPQFDAVVSGGTLTFDDNCYHSTAGPIRLALFPSLAAGGTLAFAAWQARGYDVASVETDPELDGVLAPRASTCSAAGHLAD